MKSSVAHFTGDVDKGVTPGSDHCQRMLSLMVKLMERPTYYEVRVLPSLGYSAELTDA